MTKVSDPVRLMYHLMLLGEWSSTDDEEWGWLNWFADHYVEATQSPPEIDYTMHLDPDWIKGLVQWAVNNGLK